MDRVRQSHRRPLLAPLAVAVVVGVAGISSLTRSGALLVHQCVTGEGMVGWLGLRLALLRADSACPTGSLAVGGEGRQVIGVAVVVVVPVLLAHLAGAGLGLGLLGRLGRTVRSALALLAALGCRLPESLPVVTGSAAPAVQIVRRRPLRAADAPMPWRRGPPAPQFA